jgi:hypothetical protein
LIRFDVPLLFRLGREGLPDQSETVEARPKSNTVYLHHERAPVCSRLWHDYISCILFGGNVRLAITHGNRNLSQTCRGERKSGNGRE